MADTRNGLSDAQLEAMYREMSLTHLKHVGAAFALDLAEAHARGPELEEFCRRRLALIQRVLEDRGETGFSVDGQLFPGLL